MTLPIPVGRQREVLRLPSKGHFAVLGTAGSGKTTLAILRSAFLADPTTDHGGKTLLVTYNRALVAYLRHLRDRTLANVLIENYHTFARGYLASRQKMRRDAICTPDHRLRLIRIAVLHVSSRYDKHPFFAQPIDFFSEELRWMAQHGIATLDDYQDAERVGRSGTRIKKTLRTFVFEIYDEYRKIRTSIGKMYDWDDLATAVCDELDADSSPRRNRHVVIDEGQDFSPEMIRVLPFLSVKVREIAFFEELGWSPEATSLPDENREFSMEIAPGPNRYWTSVNTPRYGRTMIRSLVRAIPPHGSLTFFGDMAQQIYGHRMSWRSAGLKIAKVWEFTENYRNTKQIARLALAISEMPFFKGVADLVEPSAPTADGPLPALVDCSSRETELDLVVTQANQLARTQNVGLLFRDRDDEKLVSPKLPAKAIRLHREMTTWQAGPGLRYGTYHSAKGLEFDAVILPFFSRTRLPPSEDVESFGEEEATAKYGRLVYVAVTRAKTRLIITFTGQVTNLLPVSSMLYQRINR